MTEENNSADFFNSAGGNNDNNKEESKSSSSKMKWVYIILLIFVLWLMFGSGDKTNNKEEANVDQSSTSNQEASKKTEESTTPQEANNSGLNEFQISNAYVPVKDIYINKASYNTNTFRLALKGEFETAKLRIKAKTTNDLKNFLSVNLGSFSGVYSNDVVFDKENPLEVSIDLKNNEKFTKSDNVLLWNYIEPKPSKDSATVVRVYATIFDEKGNYANNSEIIEFKLDYKCSENDSDCRVATCDNQAKSGGSCLIDNFGADAAKNYIDYFTRN